MSRSHVRLVSILALTAMGSMGLVGAGRVDAAVVVVTPSSMGDWAFDHRDSGGAVDSNSNGVGAMVNGPATPPLGTGSANLATGNGAANGDGAQELRSTAYNGVLLRDITSLSYSTYATANNGQQFPYLVLEIDPCISTCGGADGNYRMFFEPPYQTPGTGNASLPDQGATALNVWQTWNAFTGGWWSNNGDGGNPGTGVLGLSDFLSLYPNAELANTSGGLGAVQFRVGFASDTDVFNGYVDNFTIGVNQINTTYDFELSTPGAVPEPATLVLVALGLAGLGFSRRRQ